ncbi:hypothetical protein KCV87_03250 [Actinosynnema pretiosum subsp. pretiosum]|uniref:Uncharacterized protein n=1 Tax=Actinosynnema pretiosum subsp. pretiosum TaxID=103721 RepID=A0AA45R4U3_9PSEU|nr:hypothetical protein [Actinosynnema mirum]AXX30733.1 hypothetical protein APASM_3368 [Actinosynnema pretiosum subsp. pretiosum]QUF05149.1 hypothetical protein KCV87_03250 [Actinosynnema pretiosum subsp. pretiosum]
MVGHGAYPSGVDVVPTPALFPDALPAAAVVDCARGRPLDKIVVTV